MRFLYILFILIVLIYFVYYINYNTNNSLYLLPIIPSDKYLEKKIAVFYCYYEKNELYKENFKYFLNNGILDDVDYYIAINGESTVSLPSRPNIHIYYRENVGYDFGAYSYLLHQVNQVNQVNQVKKEYDYYFFINTSVCGPYLTNNSSRWTDYFLELFTDPSIKVVGTSINIFDKENFDIYNLGELYGKRKAYSHVQSMFFAIDNEYKNYLISQGFFDEEKYKNMGFSQVIYYGEFGLSQLAIKNGWNINCILDRYRDLDYREIIKDINPTSQEGDPYFNNSYFGRTIQPEEVIFIKSWRLENFFTSSLKYLRYIKNLL